MKSIRFYCWDDSSTMSEVVVLPGGSVEGRHSWPASMLRGAPAEVLRDCATDILVKRLMANAAGWAGVALIVPPAMPTGRHRGSFSAVADDNTMYAGSASRKLLAPLVEHLKGCIDEVRSRTQAATDSE